MRLKDSKKATKKLIFKNLFCSIVRHKCRKIKNYIFFSMEIAQIKEELKINEILDHYGLKANANKHINCPFHDDKTPSMKVYEETKHGLLL